MEPEAFVSERAKLEQQHRQGSAWFFWIAGLSLVNSVIILTGNEWSFIIGLGVTQLIDGIAVALSADLGSTATLVALFLDLLVAAAFVGLGILARRGYQAVYLVGMIVYAFDGAIFLLVQDWLSVGFHAFALFCIFAGFKANRALAELEQQPAPSVA
jgi:hypothetical protein